jgi:hypothetical protein
MNLNCSDQHALLVEHAPATCLANQDVHLVGRQKQKQKHESDRQLRMLACMHASNRQQ